SDEVHAHTEQDDIRRAEVLVELVPDLLACGDRLRTPRLQDTFALQRGEVHLEAITECLILGRIAEVEPDARFGRRCARLTLPRYIRAGGAFAWRILCCHHPRKREEINVGTSSQKDRPNDVDPYGPLLRRQKGLPPLFLKPCLPVPNRKYLR